MYDINYTHEFKRSFKRMQRRGVEETLFVEVVTTLSSKGELPVKNKNHALKGILSGYYECHIKPDWLLIYAIDKKNKTITLYDTGTHSDLFK